jgi:hypothetical protein
VGEEMTKIDRATINISAAIVVGIMLFLFGAFIAHPRAQERPIISRGVKAPERQQPTSGMTFRIAVPESRTLSGVQVNDIAGSLKPNWATVDDNQISVYDVLEEAARRGLIELPDDWTIAGDQNEMVSKKKVLAAMAGN